MLYPLILIFLLSTSPTLLSSIQCYSCDLIKLNYTLTSDTVPSFAECIFYDAEQYMLVVTGNQTD
jgi:hypothetical protein